MKIRRKGNIKCDKEINPVIQKHKKQINKAENENSLKRTWQITSQGKIIKSICYFLKYEKRGDRMREK